MKQSVILHHVARFFIVAFLLVIAQLFTVVLTPSVAQASTPTPTRTPTKTPVPVPTPTKTPVPAPTPTKTPIRESSSPAAVSASVFAPPKDIPTTESPDSGPCTGCVIVDSKDWQELIQNLSTTAQLRFAQPGVLERSQDLQVAATGLLPNTKIVARMYRRYPAQNGLKPLTVALPEVLVGLRTDTNGSLSVNLGTIPKDFSGGEYLLGICDQGIDVCSDQFIIEGLSTGKVIGNSYSLPYLAEWRNQPYYWTNNKTLAGFEYNYLEGLKAEDIVVQVTVNGQPYPVANNLIGNLFAPYLDVDENSHTALLYPAGEAVLGPYAALLANLFPSLPDGPVEWNLYVNGTLEDSQTGTLNQSCNNC